MRAYQTSGRGIDSLKVVEMPVPRLGAGQILVRMYAASLNYRDLLIARGSLGVKKRDTLIPLSDGAGEVIDIGANVARFRVGDRVCPTFSTKWIEGEMRAEHLGSARGGNVDGILAELVVCDEDSVVKAPTGFSYEEASCLPCAALTAWSALYGPRPLLSGQAVLTLGTGGVSTFAIQFAHAAGAYVIATSSSEDKLTLARTLGAAQTINYRDCETWENEVLRMTDGRGVDHVIEVGGTGTLQRSIASVAVGGQVHLIGVLTNGSIDASPLIQGKTLRGLVVGSREQFEAMNKMIERQNIKPAIDKLFGFDDVHGAYRYLESQRHFGKVVISLG